jgi:Amt family ammonium transporter
MFLSWIRIGKPDVTMTGNGLLAGLVGVTAGAWVLNGIGSLIVGFVAGLVVVVSVAFFDRIKIDDPVGAVSVHGVCGALGTIAVGLFSTIESEGVVKKGLFYGGGTDQLVSQVIGVVAIAVFVTVTTAVLFGVIKATIGLRVDEAEEIEGLDVREHGAPGYMFDEIGMR